MSAMLVFSQQFGLEVMCSVCYAQTFWFTRLKDDRDVVWLEKAVQSCCQLRGLQNMVGFYEATVSLRWESAWYEVVTGGWVF